MQAAGLSFRRLFCKELSLDLATKYLKEHGGSCPLDERADFHSWVCCEFGFPSSRVSCGRGRVLGLPELGSRVIARSGWGHQAALFADIRIGGSGLRNDASLRVVGDGDLFLIQ